MHGLLIVISFLAHIGVPLQSKILDFFTCSLEGQRIFLYLVFLYRETNNYFTYYFKVKEFLFGYYL